MDTSLDPDSVHLLLRAVIGAIENSPLAVAVFGGMWLISRVLKLVLETKADAMIRAIIALSMAIKGAAAQASTASQLRAPTGRQNRAKKTDPQLLPPAP